MVKRVRKNIAKTNQLQCMVFAISVNAMRTNIKFEKHKENPLVAWLAVFPLNSDIQFQRWFKPPMTEFIKGWFI